MSSVHLSVGRNEPASPHLRSEPWIVCRIAEATLGTLPEGSRIDWDAMAEDYTVIRRHIAHVVPGCDAYDEKVEAARRLRAAAPAAGHPDLRHPVGQGGVRA